MDTPIKKILITGCTGLVGSEAVKYFAKKEWDVIGIDYDMRSHFFGTPEKVAPLTIDIRDKESVFKLFQVHQFDAIVHCAAQPSHDYSKDHVLEDFDINARGTLILLEAARKYSPDAVFVHCSTDKIYGNGMKRNELTETHDMYESDWPFDEDTPIESPLSPFGVSKLAADYYVQEYAAQGWLTTGVFRMGCITGKAHEGAEQHGFLAYLTKCIKEGKTYKIYGYKGKQVRDQIHARDLVRVFDSFIESPIRGAVYNIGGGFERAVSPLSAAQRISEKLTKKSIKRASPGSHSDAIADVFPFKHVYVNEQRFGDRQWDVHDMSKFRSDYPDWDYEYSLDDIINDLCS